MPAPLFGLTSHTPPSRARARWAASFRPEPSALTVTPPPLPPPYGAPIHLDQARLVAEAAEREAVAQGWPMAIAIVDSGGHLVLFHRLPQTQLGSVPIAIAKAETAVNFRRPTKAFEDALAGGGQGLRLVTAPGLVALEGGLPIMQRGEVIGAIGVSGMQSTQDAQVAQAGAAALG
jgi:glc operon protein GlcG